MRRRRQGAALVIVLFAISLTSALAVGGVYLSRRFAATSRTMVAGADLHLPAEGAIVTALVGWDTAARKSQPLGPAVEVATSEAGRISTRTWIARLGIDLYWVQAESSTGIRPAFRRRVGLVVTTRSGRPEPVQKHAWSALP